MESEREKRIRSLLAEGRITGDEYETLVQTEIGDSSDALQLPAPPRSVPEKNSKRRNRLLFVFGLGLFAAAGLVVFLLLQGNDSEQNKVRVSYSIEVMTEEYCDEFFDTGFDDIPFSDVEVFDGQGNLLGFGALNGGVDTRDSCLFSADFTVVRSADGNYRVTVGNQNRGFLNYAEDDIEDGVLVVESLLRG